MGKRGPKKGAIYKPTLDKLAAREAQRALIARHFDSITLAQIAHAKGIGHLYTRDKHGKFSRVEGVPEIERLLSEGEEDRDYWIFAKDPNVQAFIELSNRFLDKPKEQPQDVNVTGTLNIVDILRQRHARHRQPE